MSVANRVSSSKIRDMAVAYPDDYDAEYLQRIRRVVFDLLNNDAGDDVRISPNTLALYTTNLPTGVHDTDLGQQAVDLQTGRATVLDYNAIDRGVALGVDIKAQEGVGG
ncbi:MAG: hypothetical protein GWN58_24645, partial [Anaerolineae bacterium]|nr:hypothetical protein [Anaerolineae bacterium]